MPHFFTFTLYTKSTYPLTKKPLLPNVKNKNHHRGLFPGDLIIEVYLEKKALLLFLNCYY